MHSLAENSIQQVLEVIDALLGPEGCPWDREQTPSSLCDYFLEESFELTEAVQSGQRQEILEEMGDVFFLLLFMSRLLKQEQGLELQEVLEQSAAKMRSRHPHVFCSREISSRQELHASWEESKRREKEAKNQVLTWKNLFQSLPRGLPPLLKAYRIHSKAARAGFTWQNNQEQQQALGREWQEWSQAAQEGSWEQKQEEFGDLLFSLVETGRRSGIKASSALQQANLKFLHRWRLMQELAEAKGLQWDDLDQETREELWQQAKAKQAWPGH
ncbi:MAG: nucleoside triphosphate pyrophosphohydrolase [Desulfohalobiaceae bacterium]